MKVQALAIFILSLLYRLDAKAFQADDNAGENEKYANPYPEKTAAGYISPSGVYSDGSRNYEMRYVPYVDGQPIIIPQVDFNHLAFPTTPTIKQSKQWQSRYQHLKTSLTKADSKQDGYYNKPNHEVKLEKYHSQPVPYDSVKSLKKATEILNKIGKKQDKKTYSNLMKSKPSTEAVNYDEYDSPQVARPDKEKEIKQAIKHHHTEGQSNDGYHEYDLPEVAGAISKGKQTDLNKDYFKDPISDDSDYDSPEVVNSLSKDNSLEDYDNPIIKKPVDKKAVKEKQIYNQYGSKEIKYLDPKPKHQKVDSHTKPFTEIKGTPETYSSALVLVKPTTFKLPTTSIKPTITKDHSKKKHKKTFKPEMKEKQNKNQNTIDKKKHEYSTKGSVSNFKYESIKKQKVNEAAVEIRDGEVTGMYDYDSPVIVEVRVQKSNHYDEDKYKNPKGNLGSKNLSDDNSDYESPVVVEALTKKKPAKNSENIKTIKVQKETNTAKEGEYESYKYPIYFESKDGTKHNTALTLQTPSPIIGLGDNVDDSIFTPLTEFPGDNEEDESEMLNDESDRFDGSGLVDARTNNEEDSRSFKSSVWGLMSNFHSQERNKFKKCLTPDKEPGNCMPIQMCPVPNLQLTLDDLLKKVCTIDEVFIGICCPEFPAETLKVQWDNIDQNWTVAEGNHFAKPEECGQYIESGKEVQSWPWMAPLISVSTRRIFCGGVLIKEQYVLTAAHCTRKIPRNQILVVLGPLSSERDPTNQEFAVVEIKRHAQYNPRTMQNDIALLKLSRKVPLDDKRRFICLPQEEETNVGDEALMLGWQGSFVASKNEESLKVISQESCRRGVKFSVGPNVMCTESRTEDVMCNLDSGAPLTVKKDGKYHVVGLMAWNRNDCDSNYPTIFTRVSHFKKWIENHSSS